MGNGYETIAVALCNLGPWDLFAKGLNVLLISKS